jgi:hypothetical protein
MLCKRCVILVTLIRLLNRSLYYRLRSSLIEGAAYLRNQKKRKEEKVNQLDKVSSEFRVSTSRSHRWRKEDAIAYTQSQLQSTVGDGRWIGRTEGGACHWRYSIYQGKRQFAEGSSYCLSIIKCAS